MSAYLDCWVSVANSLFSQALAGEPRLVEKESNREELSGIGFAASIEGDVDGTFVVALDPLVLEAALLGEGSDQKDGWREILREVAEAAAGELLASSGKKCRIASFSSVEPRGIATQAFELRTAANAWSVLLRDEVSESQVKDAPTRAALTTELSSPKRTEQSSGLSPGVELLLDVELEVALRFGCCEMPLGEILELGPGDVVELDRHVSDPVDLIVGNKIVARGDVVLVDGNFGLRVTEVAAPQKRLESIRCLF